MHPRKMLRFVRKFDLRDCRFTTMIWNISILLRCLTINIDSRYKKGIPIIFYMSTIFVVCVYLYVYFFSVLWYMFVRYPETDDLVAAMVLMSLGLCSEIGIIKFIFMLIRGKEVRRIVSNFLECDSQVIPGTRYSNNMLITLKHVKRRAVMYWLVIVINGVAYNVLPIFIPGRHLNEDFLVVYGLEPKLETPYFELTTFLATTTVTFVCFSVATISGFIIIIVGYIEARILSLAEELKHVWTDAIADKKKNKGYTYLKNEPFKIVNIYVNHRLANIINLHQNDKVLLNDLDRIFRAPLGLGFICLSMALVAMLLGGLEYTFLELPFALIQVAADCFIGQKVMDACEIFTRAIYDCKWENFDDSNKKIVLTMLSNSQKTMKLKAGGMKELNFAFLMEVLESIYNTYTRLRPVMNNKA